MCENTIHHFDSKLNELYNIINDYDENATVVLHSDHGVDFITKNTQRLSKEREKVALMIKGENIPKLKEESIKEIREVPSMIFKSANVKNRMNYTSENNYAITESIYPNQEYELSIRDNNYVLFFQVPWNFIKNRQDKNYDFKATLHDVKNENEIFDRINVFNQMQDHAIKHYADLIKNLRESDIRTKTN